MNLLHISHPSHSRIIIPSDTPAYKSPPPINNKSPPPSSTVPQVSQSGLLYWCSFVEGGLNFLDAGFLNAAARTTWLGYNQIIVSVPCHMPYTSPSTSIALQKDSGLLTRVYTNGTSYPSSYSSFWIAPSSCQVKYAVYYPAFHATQHPNSYGYDALNGSHYLPNSFRMHTCMDTMTPTDRPLVQLITLHTCPLFVQFLDCRQLGY